MIVYANRALEIRLEAESTLGLLLVYIQYGPFLVRSELLHTWN
jgi:hypothetical protein